MDRLEKENRLSPLAERVLNIVRKYEMIQPGERIVVGLSGGPDSACLLSVLRELCPVLPIRSLHAVHINHCLRGKESERDQSRAAQMAAQHGATFDVFRYDVRTMAAEQGCGEEELGRRLRYAAFESCRQKYRAHRIATAHNQNDRAETVLMRLIRGTGIRGLSGIERMRENGIIIRPLLEIRRSEIEHYCETCELDPAIDSTNLQPVYTRNRIRLQLIPLLEREYNPKVRDAMIRLADQAAEADDFIRSEAVHYLDDIPDGKTEARWSAGDRSVLPENFTMLHAAVQRRVILELLDRTGAAGNVTADAIDRIQRLFCLSKEPSETDLAGGHYIRRMYGRVWFLKRDRNEGAVISEPLPLPVELLEKEGNAILSAGDRMIRIILRERGTDVSSGRRRTVSESGVQIVSVSADLDRILQKGSPVFRNRRPGDRFRPIGMSGRKKLQNYFTDRKIPKQDRDAVLLLTSGNEILIVGTEVGAECAVTKETRRILTIEYVK